MLKGCPGPGASHTLCASAGAHADLETCCCNSRIRLHMLQSCQSRPAAAGNPASTPQQQPSCPAPRQSRLVRGSQPGCAPAEASRTPPVASVSVAHWPELAQSGAAGPGFGIYNGITCQRLPIPDIISVAAHAASAPQLEHRHCAAAREPGFDVQADATAQPAHGWHS